MGDHFALRLHATGLDYAIDIELDDSALVNRFAAEDADTPTHAGNTLEVEMREADRTAQGKTANRRLAGLGGGGV